MYVEQISLNVDKGCKRLCSGRVPPDRRIGYPFALLSAHTRSGGGRGRRAFDTVHYTILRCFMQRSKLTPVAVCVVLALGSGAALATTAQPTRVQPLDPASARLPDTLATHFQMMLAAIDEYRDMTVANRQSMAQCHRRHGAMLSPSDAAERTGCTLEAVVAESDAASAFRQKTVDFAHNIAGSASDYGQRTQEVREVLREVEGRISLARREKAAVLQRAEHIRRTLQQRGQGEAVALTAEQRTEMMRVAMELESSERRLAVLENTQHHQQNLIDNIHKGVGMLEDLQRSFELVAYRMELRANDLDLMRWSVQVSASGDGLILSLGQAATLGGGLMEAMEQTFRSMGDMSGFIQALPSEGPTQIPSIRTQLQDDRSLIDFFLNLGNPQG